MLHLLELYCTSSLFMSKLPKINHFLLFLLEKLIGAQQSSRKVNVIGFKNSFLHSFWGISGFLSPSPAANAEILSSNGLCAATFQHDDDLVWWLFAGAGCIEMTDHGDRISSSGSLASQTRRAQAKTAEQYDNDAMCRATYKELPIRASSSERGIILFRTIISPPRCSPHTDKCGL